jgi:nicotinate-nucleotide--dimethylbenzimidazole phosphoribosyltransferase
MPSPSSPTPASRDLPVDAVAFSPDVVVDPPVPEPDAGSPAVPRALPGARRLVAALARGGVSARVIAPRHQGLDHHDAHDRLRDHLRAAGLDGVGVVDADATVPGVSRARTLVVTRCPETTAGMKGAGHPVAIVEDRPVAHVLFAWWAGRTGPFAAARALAAPLDEDAAASAGHRHLRLTKPAGSLGRIEDTGALLAAIAGESPPPLPLPAATAVFAGDHGVHAQGVSPWPQEVTAQMVANFLEGGAAVNVLARQAGARVVVVDVGVATNLPPGRDDGGDTGDTGDPVGDRPLLLSRRVRAATADLATGPALTPDEARRALDVGAEIAARLVAEGARCLVTGDMGIGNTTPAAALIASLTDRPAASVTGRGAGIDDSLLTRKAAVVAAAAARARDEHGDDALAVLAEVGGLEHAALAGFVAGAVALQVPVVVDGVIAAASLLVASRLVPGVERCVVAGHRSAEPGATAVLDELGLVPLLDLDLRLGEGTGAVLALPLVEAAARVLREMATFDQAGVADKL